MQLDIKDVGPCKKTLEFVVPASEIDKQFEEKYDEIGKKVPFPGFRPRLLAPATGKVIRRDACVSAGFLGDSCAGDHPRGRSR